MEGRHPHLFSALHCLGQLSLSVSTELPGSRESPKCMHSGEELVLLPLWDEWGVLGKQGPVERTGETAWALTVLETKGLGACVNSLWEPP